MKSPHDRDLDLIYKHTHRDFKGKLNGVKTVMVLRNGGSTLVPLHGLTDAELTSKLAYAKHMEAKRT